MNDNFSGRAHRLTVDCKDNSLGYAYGNLVLACGVCNLLKNDFFTSGFSRVPVYAETKSRIVGIANIYDILFAKEGEAEEKKVSDFMRDPAFVKRSDGLDIALARLRHRRQPMGIVADEENRVVGIITIEDILEEIVGEIEDWG